MPYNPFDLSGKVALITGGNSGIGFGMAEALAASGADIVIWGSNPLKNEQAKNKLKHIDVRVLTIAVDVADESAVISGMAESVSKMGRIDTVIANAGILGKSQTFLEFTVEEYRKIMSVNLDGVIYTFREACKHMVERDRQGDKSGGSLVAISSLSALEGSPRNQAYSASKGALISMTKAIAVEHARYGIRANTILPGWIATDMTASAHGDDKFFDNIIKRVPIRRWGQPVDFGGIAVYLASDASNFHTGDSFLIDGGYSIY